MPGFSSHLSGPEKAEKLADSQVSVAYAFGCSPDESVMVIRNTCVFEVSQGVYHRQTTGSPLGRDFSTAFMDSSMGKHGSCFHWDLKTLPSVPVSAAMLENVPHVGLTLR